MEFNNAVRLILREGLAEDGIVVLVRMGEDPGADRMAALLHALDAARTGLRGERSLDRALANALYGLGFHVQGEMGGWAGRGQPLRAGWLDEEVVPMFELIEAIFEDEPGGDAEGP